MFNALLFLAATAALRLAGPAAAAPQVADPVCVFKCNQQLDVCCSTRDRTSNACRIFSDCHVVLPFDFGTPSGAADCPENPDEPCTDLCADNTLGIYADNVVCKNPRS